MNLITQKYTHICSLVTVLTFIGFLTSDILTRTSDILEDQALMFYLYVVHNRFSV